MKVLKSCLLLGLMNCPVYCVLYNVFLSSSQFCHGNSLSLFLHLCWRTPVCSFQTKLFWQARQSKVVKLWFPDFCPSQSSAGCCPQVLCSLNKDLHRDFKLRNQPNTDLWSWCCWSIPALNAARCREFMYVIWGREYGFCHLSESPDCCVYIRVQRDLLDCQSLAAQ